MKNINNVKRNCRAAKNTENIRDMALGLGADLVGIADTSLLEGIDVFLPYLFDCFPYAISIAIGVEKFGRDPEKIYSSFPDQIAIYVANYINENGFTTLIIHPEDYVDSKAKKPIISNKAVAKTAGIGWIGKSLLLVTPKLGPKVRLISVFTDMPLIPSTPLRCRCGDCEICIEACPKKALKNAQFIDHPKSREEVLEVSRCDGEKGCKFCMLACPIGK